MKPAWNALGNVMTISLARWSSAYTRTPALRSRPGFMSVTSCHGVRERRCVSRDSKAAGEKGRQGAHLEEQRRVLLKQVGRLGPERLLELLGVLARHAVPRLGLAPVHYGEWREDATAASAKGSERDRRAGREDTLWLMLCVWWSSLCQQNAEKLFRRKRASVSRPTQPGDARGGGRRAQVADVDPGHGAARDLRLDVAQERVGQDRQVVEVPLVDGVRVERVRLERRGRAAVDRAWVPRGGGAGAVSDAAGG